MEPFLTVEELEELTPKDAQARWRQMARLARHLMAEARFDEIPPQGWAAAYQEFNAGRHGEPLGFGIARTRPSGFPLEAWSVADQERQGYTASDAALFEERAIDLYRGYVLALAASGREISPQLLRPLRRIDLFTGTDVTTLTSDPLGLHAKAEEIAYEAASWSPEIESDLGREMDLFD